MHDTIDIIDPIQSDVDHASQEILQTQRQSQVNHESLKRKRAKNWSSDEVFALILAKKSEYEKYENSTSRDKMVSSTERWNSIVQSLKESGFANRDVMQCKGKWENLLLEYKLVKDFQNKSSRPNYFTMSRDDRKKENLPVQLDQEMYTKLDEFLGRRLAVTPPSTMDSSAQSDSGNNSGRTPGDMEQGSSGKRRKSNSATNAILELSTAYKENEGKKEIHYKQALDIEREKMALERERMERESMDRRELCLQLGNLANAFSKVADVLKNN